MTMISRLGFKPTKQLTTIKSIHIRSTDEVTIVIPVKDNQNGIDVFLTEFFRTHTAGNFPKEIIIVDNNSNPVIEIKCNAFPISVRLFKCNKVGPASARNFGVEKVQTDWILFI